MLSAGVLSAPTTGYGDQIKFTSNTYGVDDRKFRIATDVQAGKESVEAAKEDTVGLKDGEYTIHLSTGVEYSKDDIEKLMAKAGLDYTVEISDSNKPDGDVKMKLDIAVSESAAKKNGMQNGEGVGKDETTTTGDGLTFQIGANGVEDQRLTVNVGDMSSKALGINGISVAKQDDANAAINKLDDAIKTVSTQRAKLGAVQNRLEHTVNSLNTANENMTSSESQIRDTDMASEMIKYTKSNILQQASQSMLAQANQQPQGV
ncbi:MAG: flagellar hook protein, partial [Ruminiclostridium sp.]|nr:flagellar hook protein [Ruminiclostridium sp.]